MGIYARLNKLDYLDALPTELSKHIADHPRRRYHFEPVLITCPAAARLLEAATLANDDRNPSEAWQGSEKQTPSYR
jgi:hypothetical protein